MPLVRYEIRNEHSLANPQLYRTAAKDDPEGLLEGVAMAGLVGIVRQLGDLAEFAAEVFRDLHEEVMATASRGHDLLARVQQLEAEMPAVEKALLSETNQLRFAYTPGVEWHASIRNDQNHCTQGDLPRFIRSSYEECRGPPRLFLLDKFDVAGAGACLKRYTDPSFFRTEWASSELMKAERVQRDKRARREKKKGRRRRNADGKESILGEQYQSTFSHELSMELAYRNQAHPRMGQQPHSEVSRNASSIQEDLNRNENNALSRHVAESQGPRQNGTRTSNIPPDSPPQALDNSMDVPVPVPVPAVPAPEALTSSPPKSHKSATATNTYDEAEREWDETGPELSQWDETATEASRKDEIEVQEEATVTTVDDGGSEGDQFLDALTTMESEADSDSEAHLRRQSDADVDAGKMQDSIEGQPMASSEHLKLPGIQIPADQITTPFEQQSETSLLLDPSRQEISQEPRGIINAPGVQGISSSTIGTHSRRQSSESIASVSSRKSKHVQLLEEPNESFRPSSELSRILRDEKGATDQGSVFPFHSGVVKVEGVKVSKIVAAFESGSLDQVHAEEHQGITKISQSVGSDCINQPIAEADNDGVPEDHHSESNSPSQFCTSPVEVDSASSQDTFPKSSTPMRIRVRGTSISSRTSLGSQDSPRDSPTFSAMQSPASPIRKERNLLLSPDRLGRPTEMLSPSPASVPILAHSPTSQERRHPGFHSPERGHGQVGWESFSHMSPSSSPQSRKDPEVASQSLTANTVMDESPPTSPSSAEDYSSHLHSALPRSFDESLDSLLPVIPSEFLPVEQDSEDDFEEVLASIPTVIPPEFLQQDSEDDSEKELHDLSPTDHDSVPTSSVKPELSILPGVRGYSEDPIFSPTESIDEEGVSMSPGLHNNGADNEFAKAEERVQQRPTLLRTPSDSRHDSAHLLVSKRGQDPFSQLPLQHDLPPPFLASVKHDNMSSTSARSFETASQFSRDDFVFIPKAAHRRFPSLPLVEKSVPDFSHAAPSTSSRSSPGSLIPSKPTSVGQLSAKFGLNAPFPSQMPRIVHDVPYSVRKGAHNRFPSFPSSEGSLLDVSSVQRPSISAAPSRHARDEQIPASKFQHDLPSLPKALGNLPSPTPPSKSERGLSSPSPPSSLALDELPPPPPPPPDSSLPSSATKPLAGIDGGILEAIASHDKGTLKKVRTMQNPVLRKGDERSHLLEQIRAQSFNLRHTVVEKVDSPVPRPVTNINVAAILEKANAIRQAFAGSDEDDDDNDDWSDV